MVCPRPNCEPNRFVDLGSQLFEALEKAAKRLVDELLAGIQDLGRS